MRKTFAVLVLLLAGSCDSCEPPEVSYSDDDLSATVPDDTSPRRGFKYVPHPIKFPHPDLATPVDIGLNLDWNDIPRSCTTDVDCYRFFNQCGECSCHAIRADATVPTCPTTYNICFVNACIGRVAVCEAGVCTLQ